MMTTALLCMSLNIYFEARGESLTGQRAVANVTWNRAQYDENKVCDVVTKSSQFSWTIDKLERKDGIYVLKTQYTPKDKEAWASAVFTARLIMKIGERIDYTYRSDHYHTKSVNPWWNKKMKKTRVVGNHIFYKSNT